VTARVTVVVGCFNHAGFLEECLDSIDDQTYRDFELIFVDDASTDDSVEVARRRMATLGVPHTLVVHPTNTRICRTFNDGLRRAKGDYVVIMSADDRWYPWRLADQVELLDAAPPAVGAAYADADVIDEHSTITADGFLETMIGDRRPDGDLYFELLDQAIFVPHTVLIRTAVFETIGFLDESLETEDHDLWLRISRSFSFAYHPRTSGSYRVLSTSLNSSLDWRRRLQTRWRTYAKFVDEPGERGRAARRKQYEMLAKLYVISPRSVRPYAWRTMITTPSVKTFGMALLATAGIRYETAKRVGRRLLRPVSRRPATI
jgi:glycosyltransferase involved in cell wall biosynthesis